MKLRKISRDQAFAMFKEGVQVYQVMEVKPYSLYSINDLVEMEFAVAIPPEIPERDSDTVKGDVDCAV